MRFLLIALFMLAGVVAPADVYYQERYYRDVELVLWQPTVTVARVTVGTNGAFAATGTWYYAVAATSSLGRTVYGPLTNAVVTNGSSVVIQWRRTGGATGYEVWRGSSTNALTNRVTVGNVTNWTDTGTQAWTAATSTWTATNVPAIYMPTGWTPSNDRHLATKKYVDDYAGLGALTHYLQTGEAYAVFAKLTDLDDYASKEELSTNLTGYIQSLNHIRFAPSVTNLTMSPGFNLFSIYDTIPVTAISTNGVGDAGGNGDRLVIRNPDGSWKTVYLQDSPKRWTENFSAASTSTIAPRQIFYYQNAASSNVVISIQYTNALSDFSLVFSSAEWAGWYFWVKNWLGGGGLAGAGPLTITGTVVASSSITAGGSGFIGPGAGLTTLPAFAASTTQIAALQASIDGLTTGKADRAAYDGFTNAQAAVNASVATGKVSVVDLLASINALSVGVTGINEAAYNRVTGTVIYASSSTTTTAIRVGQGGSGGRSRVVEWIHDNGFGSAVTSRLNAAYGGSTGIFDLLWNNGKLWGEHNLTPLSDASFQAAMTNFFRFVNVRLTNAGTITTRPEIRPARSGGTNGAVLFFPNYSNTWFFMPGTWNAPIDP